MTRLLAIKLLKKHGHAGYIGRQWERGYGRDRAAGSEFELILMEVQMPEASGIRGEPADSRTGGWYGAAHPDGGHAFLVAVDRERCLAAGMDDYISKPIKIREFMEMKAEVVGFPQAHNKGHGQ